MKTELTYKRRFCEWKPVDFHSKNSFCLFRQLTGLVLRWHFWKKDSQGVPKFICTSKGRCKQRSDSRDWKVVSASLLSHIRSRRVHYTTSVLHVGLRGSKAEIMEIKVMYHRRRSEEKPIDFHTKISSLSSASVCSCIRPRGVLNTTLVLPVGLLGGKREAEKIEMKVTYQRRLSEDKPVDFHTKISSRFSDGISRKRIPKECPNLYVRPRRKCTQRSRSSDQKVVSASSCSRRRSKRIRNATSVLRRPLQDSLFDHCFRNIWRESPEERRNPCTYLSCFCFYMYTKDHNRERVLSWIKKQNIFSKRYVFVPIVLWSHWSLLIFCHLGESLQSKTRTPCMLLLDSLHAYGAPPKLEPLIRRLVLDIFETEGRPENKDMVQKIPLLVPEVPQQRNSEECGIFVLYYISLFLESAPESFSFSSGYPYFMKEDWFTEEELEGFYDRLESLGLESSDSEEGLEPSDSEETIERIVGDIRKSL